MVLSLAVNHLKSILKDLECCRDDGSWKIQPSQSALYDAGLIAFRDAINALDTYFVTQNATKVHQELITVGMEFCARWERWIAGLRCGSLESAATKTFHEYLLRFTKGALKAYRIWRIDLLR